MRAPLGFGLAVAASLGAAVAGCGQVDNRPAEWAFISPAIFQPSCATPSCHSPAASVSGLDFSTADNGYASLTLLDVVIVPFADGGGTNGLAPCPPPDEMQKCKPRPLVTPYDPAGSRVVNMLRARDAPRMPPDRPLPEDDIKLVERWILNGAQFPGFSARDAGMDVRPPDAQPSDARPSDGGHD